MGHLLEDGGDSEYEWGGVKGRQEGLREEEEGGSAPARAVQAQERCALLRSL